MILLDTHIWIWHVAESERLSEQQHRTLTEQAEDGLGVSVISCWEVAKLVEYGRLELDRPVQDWMEAALTRPDIQLIELTPQIAVASTCLPLPFHRDPADQIIVATARMLDLPLMTVDQRILAYEHVYTLPGNPEASLLH